MWAVFAALILVLLLSIGIHVHESHTLKLTLPTHENTETEDLRSFFGRSDINIHMLIDESFRSELIIFLPSFS